MDECLSRAAGDKIVKPELASLGRLGLQPINLLLIGERSTR
jgi:hypothetical protein